MPPFPHPFGTFGTFFPVIFSCLGSVWEPGACFLEDFPDDTWKLAFLKKEG
jgi:hypothetical protein